MSPSRAIYLTSEGELTIREITDTYVPEGGQDLVSVKYSSIVPADIRHYYMGLHSYVAGYEWIGTVVTPGPASTHKAGDVLFGFAKYGHMRPQYKGAHQDMILADPFLTYEMPSELAEDPKNWTQVVNWPVPVHTATDALFNVLGFSFPRAGITKGADPRGRSILIVGLVFIPRLVLYPPFTLSEFP